MRKLFKEILWMAGKTFVKEMRAIPYNLCHSFIILFLLIISYIHQIWYEDQTEGGKIKPNKNKIDLMKES